jgi:hypothetical protein
MALTYYDLSIAFEFVSSAEAGDYEGFVCRKTGKIYLRAGEFGDPLPDEDQLPEDLDQNEQYVAFPNKRDFDLGKPLVLDFAREFLADDFEEVRRIFSKRGHTDSSRRCWLADMLSIVGINLRRRRPRTPCGNGALRMGSRSPIDAINNI